MIHKECINDIDIFFTEVKSSQKKMYIIFDKGSITEDSDKNGITHLLEHLIINSNSIFDWLLSGITEFNYMLLKVENINHNVDIEEYFKVLYYIISSLSITKKDFEGAQLEVINEINRNLEHIDRLKRRYGIICNEFGINLPLGYKQAINKITLSEIFDFYSDYMKKARFCIILLGFEFNKETMENIEEYFIRYNFKNSEKGIVEEKDLCKDCKISNKLQYRKLMIRKILAKNIIFKDSLRKDTIEDLLLKYFRDYILISTLQEFMEVEYFCDLNLLNKKNKLLVYKALGTKEPVNGYRDLRNLGLRKLIKKDFNVKKLIYKQDMLNLLNGQLILDELSFINLIIRNFIYKEIIVFNSKKFECLDEIFKLNYKEVMKVIENSLEWTGSFNE